MIPEDRLQGLIERWSSGDETALDRLIEVLYDDLRALAHRHLETERPNHTLSTTALVHEVYLELSGRTGISWRGRPQLLALTSRIMRSVLIDHARRRKAAKRGGANRVLVPLDLEDPGVDAAFVELLVVDEALDKLQERDERLAEIVVCRFYGGMTSEDIAAALGVSTRTVRREWALARSFLFTLLRSPNKSSEAGP